jgi:hypothetical protein
MHVDNSPHDVKEFDTGASNPEGDKNLLGIKKQQNTQQPSGEIDTKAGKHTGDKNKLWQHAPDKPE